MDCARSIKAFAKNLALVTVAHVTGIFWCVVVAIRLAIAYYRGTVPVMPKKERDPPSCLSDPSLGEHGFLYLKNGQRIHYVAAGPKEKPLLLFIHGFPDFWYGWRHQLKYFQQNYRVVAIDNRGYGESDKPRSWKSYALPFLIDDVRCVIETLGRESCTVVAHDWGGIISWLFASAYPHMVDRLIILNCPHPKSITEMPAGDLFRQFLKSWYIMMFQLPCLPEYLYESNDLSRLEAVFTKPPMGAKRGTFTTEDIEALKYTFGQEGAFTPPINYYRNLIRICPPKMPEMHPLKMPILMIFGTADAALSVESAKASRKFAKGHFELELLEGVSHWVQHEEPEKVNQFIEKFLRKDIPSNRT